MPSGHELDTELAHMRRTLRRLVAVMTLGLIVGVGAIAAVVGLTLSSADKEAARSFDSAWRKDNGKDTRAAQVRPATVGQPPAASPNPSAPSPAPATASAAPKPSPSRPETTGAAPPASTASSASTTPRPTSQTTGADHSIKTTPDQASNESSEKTDRAASQPRKKRGRRYLARTRTRPSDERAYYSDNGRSSADDTTRGPQRPDRVIVLRRPGVEARPQADGPSDYGGGRESPRGGLFGELFGTHPD